MNQPPDASISGLPGYMEGSLTMDHVECRRALLNIVADGIDDGNRLLHCPGNRRLVPYVGVHEFDLAVPAEPFDEGCALGMAHRHADLGPLGGQRLHNLATKESRSSEYGYPFGCPLISLLKTEA